MLHRSQALWGRAQGAPMLLIPSQPGAQGHVRMEDCMNGHQSHGSSTSHVLYLAAAAHRSLDGGRADIPDPSPPAP